MESTNVCHKIDQGKITYFPNYCGQSQGFFFFSTNSSSEATALHCQDAAHKMTMFTERFSGVD